MERLSWLGGPSLVNILFLTLKWTSPARLDGLKMAISPVSLIILLILGLYPGKVLG